MYMYYLIQQKLLIFGEKNADFSINQGVSFVI